VEWDDENPRMKLFMHALPSRSRRLTRVSRIEAITVILTCRKGNTVRPPTIELVANYPLLIVWVAEE